MSITRGAVLLQEPEQRWECPNCDVTHVNRGFLPNRFHQCQGKGLLAGLMAPLVPAGTRCQVTVREREDFIGNEDVQLHQGRPVMSVVTEREDGTDAVVFAPTAHAIAS